MAFNRLRYALYKIGATEVWDVYRVFDKFDENKDGVLDRAEIKKVMAMCKKDISEVELDFFWSHFDANCDGKITKSEFLKGIKGELSQERL